MLFRSLLCLLVTWLKSLPPKELEALAQQDASIVDFIRRRHGSLVVAWARGYLTAPELAEIAELTDADFDALLDEGLAAACPSQAAVLMRYRPWYRSQMRAVQAALVGRTMPDGRTRSSVAPTRRPR